MQQRPITYRAEIIEPLLSSIAAGECCSLVGMSGVGKSNLVQHMLRPEVLGHYLGARAEALRFVMFDTNMLAEWSAWGFFEGLSEALITTLSASLPIENSAELHAAHDHLLVRTGNAALALRQCAQVLALLCAQWRVVVLFDEFDPLFAQLESRVLRNLRGLRDRHKYRLVFLTFSRQPLTDLRDADEWDEIEPFAELFSLRELGLGPLSANDAAAEVDRFAGRHNRQLAAEAGTRIVELSGGHPALVRALTQAALAAQPPTFDVPTSLRQPATRLECTKIWQQLTGDEQDGLLHAARSEPLAAQERQRLALKGLLRIKPGGDAYVFSPLFAAYLQSIGLPPAHDAPAPLVVDRERSQILYYGRSIAGLLRPLERRLIFYLWERYGQICSLAEIARALYPNEPLDPDDSRELDRVRTVARRLRQQLVALVPDQPVLLSIHRFQGVQLGLAQYPQPTPAV